MIELPFQEERGRRGDVSLEFVRYVVRQKLHEVAGEGQRPRQVADNPLEARRDKQAYSWATPVEQRVRAGCCG